jgi:hypothetical protein
METFYSRERLHMAQGNQSAEQYEADYAPVVAA